MEKSLWDEILGKRATRLLGSYEQALNRDDGSLLPQEYLHLTFKDKRLNWLVFSLKLRAFKFLYHF